jgi:hypothetical protein
MKKIFAVLGVAVLLSGMGVSQSFAKIVSGPQDGQIPFVVTKNSDMREATATPGATWVKIGSYNLTAGYTQHLPTNANGIVATPPQDISVNYVTITTGSNGAEFKNLRIWTEGSYNTSAIQEQLSSNTSYTFAMPFTVPAYGTVTLNVTADVLPSATPGTKFTLTTFAGCSAQAAGGGTSSSIVSNTVGSYVPCNSAAGQNVNVIPDPNPHVATITVGASAIGSEVTADTTNNVVGGWTFVVAWHPVILRQIRFTVTGSANPADLQNVKLYVNGVQAGATLASVAPDGTAVFTLTGNPTTLNFGADSIQVHADVMGSSGKTFRFQILNATHVFATDSWYNVPVYGQANAGSEVVIKMGSVTLRTANDTPTGSITPGMTGVILAKFTFNNATGEAVNLKWLGWGLSIQGSGVGSIDSNFSNVRLLDDVGSQVGVTVSQLSTPVTCTDTPYSSSSTQYRSCFGSASSPVNYVVPNLTTRTLSLVADVNPHASFAGVTARITPDTYNVLGLVSGQSVSTDGATGAMLSLIPSVTRK